MKLDQSITFACDARLVIDVIMLRVAFKTCSAAASAGRRWGCILAKSMKEPTSEIGDEETASPTPATAPAAWRSAPCRRRPRLGAAMPASCGQRAEPRFQAGQRAMDARRHAGQRHRHDKRIQRCVVLQPLLPSPVRPYADERQMDLGTSATGEPARPCPIVSVRDRKPGHRRQSAGQTATVREKGTAPHSSPIPVRPCPRQQPGADDMSASGRNDCHVRGLNAAEWI